MANSDPKRTKAEPTKTPAPQPQAPKRQIFFDFASI